MNAVRHASIDKKTAMRGERTQSSEEKKKRKRRKKRKKKRKKGGGRRKKQEEKKEAKEEGHQLEQQQREEMVRGTDLTEVLGVCCVSSDFISFRSSKGCLKGFNELGERPGGRGGAGWGGGINRKGKKERKNEGRSFQSGKCAERIREGCE